MSFYNDQHVLYHGLAATYIMLLDDLLKAGIIELGELGKIVHIGYDITQVFLEQQEVVLGRRLDAARSLCRVAVLLL